MNATLSNSQQIGLLFEKNMAENFELCDLILDRTKDTDFKYIADFIESDTNSLIEVKSHRIPTLESESTIDSFSKKIRDDIKRSSQSNGHKSGLLWQLIEMGKSANCSLAILGIYSEFVNKVIQDLATDGLDASDHFFAYKVLINHNNIITYQTLTHELFWDYIAESKSVIEFAGRIKQAVNQHKNNENSGQCDGLREFVKDLDLGLTSDQIDQYFTQIITQNIEPLSWVQEAQEQITFEATEIESNLSEDMPFSKSELALIEDAIRSGEPFEDISRKLGKSQPYLYGCLKPENNKGLHWDNFRNWINPILNESEHIQTPFEWASDSFKEKLYNHICSRLHGQLALSGRLKSQIEQFKQELEQKENIMNQQEDKGLSQLQKEAYEAEIERLKSFTQGQPTKPKSDEVQADELQKKIDTMNQRYDWLGDELSRNERIIEGLLLLIEKLK